MTQWEKTFPTIDLTQDNFVESATENVNIMKASNQIYKMDCGSIFGEQKVLQRNESKHFKRWSTSLAIRETQIEAKLSPQLTPAGMANTLIIDDNNSCMGMTKWASLTLLMGAHECDNLKIGLQLSSTEIECPYQGLKTQRNG